MTAYLGWLLQILLMWRHAERGELTIGRIVLDTLIGFACALVIIIAGVPE